MGKQIMDKHVMDFEAMKNVITFLTSSANDIAEKNEFIKKVNGEICSDMKTSGMYDHNVYTGACSMDLMRNPDKIVAMSEQAYNKAAPNEILKAYE